MLQPFFYLFFFTILLWNTEAVRHSSNKYGTWPAVCSKFMSLPCLSFKLQAEAHSCDLLGYVPNANGSGCVHPCHGTAVLERAHWWHTQIIVFPGYLVALTSFVYLFWGCIMKLLTKGMEKKTPTVRFFFLYLWNWGEIICSWLFYCPWVCRTTLCLVPKQWL